MIFSYTLLRDYGNCPEAVRQITILKNYKKTFTGDMLNGTDVHNVLEKRIKNGPGIYKAEFEFGDKVVHAFEKRGTVEAEVPLAVNRWLQPISFWGESGVGAKIDPLIRGKFDVVVTSGDAVVYADWKTGKPYENNEMQFRIGALLLFAARPAVQQVTGLNVWLKTGKLGQPYVFTRERASIEWAPLMKKMAEIDARKTDVEWEKQDGPLCSYCPVKSCNFYRGG